MYTYTYTCICRNIYIYVYIYIRIQITRYVYTSHAGSGFEASHPWFEGLTPREGPGQKKAAKARATLYRPQKQCMVYSICYPNT